MNPEKWNEVELNNLCSLIADCPHSTPKWTDAGVFVIRSWNVRDGVLNFDKTSYTDEKTFQERIRRAKPTAGDIVITREAPMGEVAMIPNDLECCLGQRLVLPRPDAKKINKTFLLYSLQSTYVQNQILSNEGTGSTVSNLRIPDLKALKIKFPSVQRQKKIADTLSSIDEKIELNRQTAQTLEAIAQAIFKEWFVDFNFPGATGEMQESELGEIPKEWRVVSFEEELNADRGLSYKGNGLSQDGGVPMHNLNSVFEGGGYKKTGIKYYTGDFKEKHVVEPGDLIIANTEQGHKYLLIGYPAIVPTYYGEKGIFSHHIYKLKPKQHSYLTSEFLFHLLLQPEVREQVTGFANGTTVNMLKVEGLQKPLFVLPSQDTVQRFTEIALSLRNQSEESLQQNQTLSQLRDELLP